MSENNNMRSEIKHREMMEIHSVPAVHVDRMYITPKRMAVVLSFCEDIPHAEENRVRARLGMTLEVFMHFADMMAQVAQQVREHQAQQQVEAAQKNPSEDVAKKALN